MRNIVLAAAAAAILSVGFSADPAEAMIGAPASIGLAAEYVAPVENAWCGWHCRHHRFIIIRRHHRPFFHRRWWGGWC